MDKGLLDLIALSNIREAKEERRYEAPYYATDSDQDERAVWRRLAYEVPLTVWFTYWAITLNWSADSNAYFFADPALDMTLRAIFWGSLPITFVLLAIGRATWPQYFIAPIVIVLVWFATPPIFF